MNTQRTRDFPDWIGPMLVKELRQGLKARAFELTFISLQVILSLVVGYHALLYGRHKQEFDADGLHGTFWFIVGLQLLAVTPLRALGGLTNERKANTLELIFMTGLSAWRITWGKWASLFFQAILFVLAVLPYGVLRYFFGGVNLYDDCVILGSMLLASAVLSAIALAISGLPVFVRVGAFIFFGMFGMTGTSAFLSTMFVRGSAGGPFTGWGFDPTWSVLIFNAVVIALGALSIAAWTIAPVAENHALRQRLLVLVAWLPVPVLKLLGADEHMVGLQLGFFVMLGLAVSWFHFAIQPPAMRVHLEPFARRNRLAQSVGFLFQPGWPSAVLFLVLVELIFFTTTQWITSDPNDAVAVTAIVTMAGAALLTPPLIWRVFRLRTKAALILQTLFLGLCGGLSVLVNTLTDAPMGHNLAGALLPPFGFFAMLDSGIDRLWMHGWFAVGTLAFALLTTMLLLLSRSYWVKMLAYGREIRSKPVPERAPLPVEVAA